MDWIVITRSIDLITVFITILCSLSISQKNLSPIGTATQSSTLRFYPANLAVTGGPTNDFSSRSCSHTGVMFSMAAWWMLTLPNDTFSIEEITIYYRGDSNGIDGFSLYMSNISITGTNKQTPPGHLCYQDVADGKYSSIQTIQCNQLARNVIIYNDYPKNAYGPFLELCDVQVIGCSQKMYGNNCREECSMKCFDQHCYPSNGSCVWGCNCYDNSCNSDQTCTRGCKTGFGSQHCNEKNIASKGFPSQYPPDNSSPAELAIDGIRTGNICAKTSGTVTWWKLDLGALSVIETIYLSFTKNDTIKQYARHHSLFISNSSVKWKDGRVLQMTSNFDISFPFVTYSIYPAAVGRYIIYEPKAITGNSYVDICEVEVVGCTVGFYGENCNKTCSENCNGPCNITTGVCMFGCMDGWINPYCNKSCENSKFGPECIDTCHCYNKTETCDHVTGQCPEGGCMKGWKGTSCSSECETDSYGYNCNESCYGCVGRQCNTVSGECENTLECNPGWVKELPFCKTACPLGRFGRNCANMCRCINSRLCNRIDGICPPGGCQKGWQGINCSTECTLGTYGLNCDNTCNQCYNKHCNSINGSCTYGYQNDHCELMSQEQHGILVPTATMAAVIIVTLIINIVLVIIAFLFGRKSAVDVDMCRLCSSHSKKRLDDQIYENDVDCAYEMNVNDENEGYSTLSDTLDITSSRLPKDTDKPLSSKDQVYEVPDTTT